MSTRNQTPPLLRLVILVGVMVVGAAIAYLLLGPESPARNTLSGMNGQAKLMLWELVGTLSFGAIVLTVYGLKS